MDDPTQLDLSTIGNTSLCTIAHDFSYSGQMSSVPSEYKIVGCSFAGAIACAPDSDIDRFDNTLKTLSSIGNPLGSMPFLHVCPFHTSPFCHFMS